MWRTYLRKRTVNLFQRDSQQHTGTLVSSSACVCVGRSHFTTLSNDDRSSALPCTLAGLSVCCFHPSSNLLRARNDHLSIPFHHQRRYGSAKPDISGGSASSSSHSSQFYQKKRAHKNKPQIFGKKPKMKASLTHQSKKKNPFDDPASEEENEENDDHGSDNEVIALDDTEHKKLEEAVKRRAQLWNNIRQVEEEQKHQILDKEQQLRDNHHRHSHHKKPSFKQAFKQEFPEWHEWIIQSKIKLDDFLGLDRWKHYHSRYELIYENRENYTVTKNQILINIHCTLGLLGMCYWLSYDWSWMESFGLAESVRTGDNGFYARLTVLSPLIALFFYGPWKNNTYTGRFVTWIKYDHQSGDVRYCLLSVFLCQRFYKCHINDLIMMDKLRESKPELAAGLPQFLNVYDLKNNRGVFIEGNDVEHTEFRLKVGLCYEEELLPLT